MDGMTAEWFYRAIDFEDAEEQERRRQQSAAAKTTRDRGPAIRTMGSE